MFHSQNTLHLDAVTEADAGTYVCRISNRRTTIEARAILRVEGVVPRFGGESWLSLPTLKDAYIQFDIEISFKPSGKYSRFIRTNKTRVYKTLREVILFVWGVDFRFVSWC